MITQISTSQIQPQLKQNNQPLKQTLQISQKDCFVPNFGAKKINKPSIFTSLKNIFSSGEEPIKPFSTKEPTTFQLDLAKGIKASFDEDIPAQNFENIMSVEEFKEILPSLTEENFIFDESFEENTLYSFDLDYSTLYSSKTEEQIDDLLDRVEEHAKKYYERTGKKFVFAVADKDNIYGIRQIIRTIGENPEKYQHFKLLPAIKLAYTHKAPTSKIGFENSELLIYGINPFSENLTNFVDKTIEKRKEMPLNFIKEINRLYPDFAYNILEFAEQNRLLFSKDYTVSNLYWRTREYAEGKGGDTLKSKKETPEDLYREVASIMDSLGNSLFGEEEGLPTSSTNIEIDDENFNKSIKELFEKYSTHIDSKTGELISAAENTYKEIIDCLSKEKEKPVIAFSSPFYLSHYFEERNHDESYENVINFMQETIDESKGMLSAFESISPIYPKDKYVSEEQIEKFNNIIRQNTNLHEVGGSFPKIEPTS